MKKLLVGLSLLAVSVVSSAVQAQGLGSKIEVGAFGSYTKLDEKLKMENPLGIGGTLGMTVYKWLGIEGSAQYGTTKATRAPFEDIKYEPVRGLATLTIPVASKTALVLGGGYVNSIYKGRSTANEYEDGVAFLAGLKVCGGGKWGGRLDGLYDMNPSPNEQELAGTSRNMGVRAGVTYAMRGTCAMEKFDWTLSIAPATASVDMGTSRAFALSGSDAKARPIVLAKILNLNCTSSDPSVATVNAAGNVQALKPGNTTISCNGTVKKLPRSASATVTVPAPAWTLAVTPATQTRDVGQTAAFAAAARDAKGADLGASTWTSSNPGVATVSNGTATCVSGGTTTITASKTMYGTTKTATASLTCIAPPPPMAMIRLDSTQFDFNKATVLPAGMAVLQTVVDAMKRDPSIRIDVEGHTDWYGEESYNQKLSVSRATAVVAAIKKLAGTDIAADRISMVGFGEQCIVVRDGDPDPKPPRPRVSAANKAKQAPNRRVEIWQLMPNESGSPTSCRADSQHVGRVPFTSMK